MLHVVRLRKKILVSKQFLYYFFVFLLRKMLFEWYIVQFMAIRSLNSKAINLIELFKTVPANPSSVGIKICNERYSRLMTLTVKIKFWSVPRVVSASHMTNVFTICAYYRPWKKSIRVSKLQWDIIIAVSASCVTRPYRWRRVLGWTVGECWFETLGGESH